MSDQTGETRCSVSDQIGEARCSVSDQIGEARCSMSTDQIGEARCSMSTDQIEFVHQPTPLPPTMGFAKCFQLFKNLHCKNDSYYA